MGGLPRLHLGSGDKYWEGFVNCDYADNWSGAKVDVACDITKLPFDDESVAEIHAIHVIEHFPRPDVEEVLTEWLRVLIPGGKIALECPDLMKVIKVIHDGNRRDLFIGAMFGLYGNQWQGKAMGHHWCYTRGELNKILKTLGCSEVVSKEPIFHQHWRDLRVVATK